PPELPSTEVAVVPLLRSVGLLDDTRRPVAILLRDVCVEHVRGLADVIVDRDQDELVAVHAAAFPSASTSSSRSVSSSTEKWRPSIRSVRASASCHRSRSGSGACGRSVHPTTAIIAAA